MKLWYNCSPEMIADMQFGLGCTRLKVSAWEGMFLERRGGPGSHPPG